MLVNNTIHGFYEMRTQVRVTKLLHGGLRGSVASGETQSRCSKLQKLNDTHAEPFLAKTSMARRGRHVMSLISQECSAAPLVSNFPHPGRSSDLTTALGVVLDVSEPCHQRTAIVVDGRCHNYQHRLQRCVQER